MNANRGWSPLIDGFTAIPSLSDLRGAARPPLDRPLHSRTPAPHTEPPKPRLLADLLANPPEPTPDLIPGVLRAGGSLLLTAPRAVGKSWLSLQLALAVADGTRFLDFGPSPLGPQNVLIISGEIDEATTAERHQTLTGSAAAPFASLYVEGGRYTASVVSVRRTFAGHEGPRPDPSSWSYSVGQQFAILEPHREHCSVHPDGCSELEHFIIDHDIALVIIDPWATFMGGDENSNDDTQRVVGLLDGLRRSTGVTVVVIHHFGKAPLKRGASPEDQGRGAGRLPDAFDSRLTMTSVPGHSELRRLHFLLRHHRERDDLFLAVDPNTRYASVTDPPENVVSRQRRRLTPEQVAEEVNSSGGFESTRKAHAHMKSKGHSASEGTVRTALQDACGRGLVRSENASRGATRWLPVDPDTGLDDPGDHSDPWDLAG